MSRLGAIQGQDYPGAKYSIGLRVPGSGESAVDRTVEEGRIVRTWLFRGTLHLAAAADVRRMLALVAPRLIAGSVSRDRNLGLDEAVYEKSRKLFRKALRGGNRLTRGKIYELLEKAGISTAGQRGYHLLWRTALEGLICFGPPLGKEQSFVLLDDWVPGSGRSDRSEVSSDLAKRYFSSRGPRDDPGLRLVVVPYGSGGSDGSRSGGTLPRRGEPRWAGFLGPEDGKRGK